MSAEHTSEIASGVKACTLPDATECNGEHCDCPLTLTPDFEELPAVVRRIIRAGNNLRGGWYGNDQATRQRLYDALAEELYEFTADTSIPFDYQVPADLPSTETPATS